jgi:hypothetical protein
VPNKRNLTELLVRKAKAEGTALNIWDLKERGLVLRVQPSGHRAFKAVYSIGGRARWFHIGNVHLADARKMAQQVRFDVAHGKDPAAERRAERNSGTFAELAERYVSEHAKKKNKSWAQADYLVRRHLLPRLGKLGANSVLRKDVRAAVGRIESPSVANQVPLHQQYSRGASNRNVSPPTHARASSATPPRAASGCSATPRSRYFGQPLPTPPARASVLRSKRCYFPGRPRTSALWKR